MSGCVDKTRNTTTPTHLPQPFYHVGIFGEPSVIHRHRSKLSKVKVRAAADRQLELVGGEQLQCWPPAHGVESTSKRVKLRRNLTIQHVVYVPVLWYFPQSEIEMDREREREKRKKSKTKRKKKTKKLTQIKIKIK